MTFQSVLCPVDFSSHSRNALRVAAAAAQRFSSSMTVMFVNDPLLLVAASRAYGGQRRFVERTKTELGVFVRQSIGNRSRPRQPTTLLVSSGDAATAISNAIKRLRPDVVVMGTHGLSGVRKLLIGSTTEQVLRGATVPVLAVPAGARPAPRGPLVFTRVVVPVDLQRGWRADVIRASTVAAAFHAELVLVHVLTAVQTPPWIPALIRPDEGRRIDDARKALERVRGDVPSEIRLTPVVLVGNQAHEIARLASGLSSLVVMSLRGAAGMWGARQGSIAYHVLTHSTTPILALPRQPRTSSSRARRL